MKEKKLQKLSIITLIISLLPLVALVPSFIGTTLSDFVRTIWTGANIIMVLASLALSVICVRNRESRSAINIASTIISVLWVLIMVGIIALALFINFVQ